MDKRRSQRDSPGTREKAAFFLHLGNDFQADAVLALDFDDAKRLGRLDSSNPHLVEDFAIR
ncbi:MAG: hypothetical protein IK066_07955 [Kiritimatiellae bacterium]|nr:hypothetical protein [Kiritimatiellia bacterium]